jgi:hypothetical protein
MLTLLKKWFTRKERMPTDFELSDLGLSRASYRRLISSSVGTRSRMEKLASQFDVTPAMIDADRGLALELAEVCGHCQSAKACQNALDLDVDFDASRCPNATIYKDMSPA